MAEHIPTFLRIRNAADATHVRVIDQAGADVLPPTPLVVAGNLRYLYAPLPTDRGVLTAMFTRDADGLDSITESTVEDPRREPSDIVVGAWLIREGLTLLSPPTDPTGA